MSTTLPVTTDHKARRRLRASTSSLTRFRTDPVGFLRRLSVDNERFASFRIGRFPLTLVLDPADIDELLGRKQSAFKKGPGLLRLTPLLGGGLLTADGESHRNARHLLAPAVSRARITEFSPSIAGITAQVMEGWKSGQELELFQEMVRVTLNIVSAAFFKSRPIPSETVMDGITGAMTTLYGGLCPHARPGQPLNSLTGIADRLIDELSAAPETDDHLIALLNRSGIAPGDMRGHVLTFLLGGHESVATSLTWTFFSLSQHPSVRDRLFEEIDLVDLETVSASDLPFTRAVINESLRIYPPAWMFSREAIEPVTIGGQPFDAGTVFVLAPCVTHVDRRHWDDPMEFRPERWLNDRRQATATAGYFPFGGGLRRCIGEQFALNEIAIVLAAIGKEWLISRPPNAQAPEFEPVVTLRPKGGMAMIVSRR